VSTPNTFDPLTICLIAPELYRKHPLLSPLWQTLQCYNNQATFPTHKLTFKRRYCFLAQFITPQGSSYKKSHPRYVYNNYIKVIQFPNLWNADEVNLP
jgi:hypothetical protein